MFTNRRPMHVCKNSWDRIAFGREQGWRFVRRARKLPGLLITLGGGVLLILGALVCRCSFAAQPAKTTRHVLMLYLEEMTLPAMSRLESNIRQSLVTQHPTPIQFYTEHLDPEVLTDEKIVAEQFAWYQHKYAAADLDLIIIVGFEAYPIPRNFFSGTPMIYCIRSFGRAPLPHPAAVDIDVWVGDEMARTVDAARGMDPHLHEVVVVAGSAATDKAIIAEARRELEPFKSHLKLTYWTDITESELIQRAATLPRDSIIIFTLFLADANGIPMIPRELLSRVSKRSSVPIYAVFDTYIGYGAVGGYIASYEREGQLVGEAAGRILSGEKPEQIHPDVRQANLYMFDARELLRWQMDRNHLPAGSTVMNEPPGIWTRYRWEITSVLVFVALESLALAALLAERVRRKRAQRALSYSEARFRSMYEQAAVGIEQVAPDGRLLMVNPALCQMLGYSESELLNKTVADITDERDKNSEAKLVASLISGERDFYNLEKRYIRRDGAHFWVIITSSAVRRNDKAFLYRISIVRDISDRKKAQDEVEALTGRLITAQEEERTRIAREIHDDFSQRLALLSMQQEKLRQELRDDQVVEREQLSAMTEQVTLLASGLRSLSHELHSSTLEHIGLSAALEDLCDEVSQAHGITIRFVDYGIPENLRSDVALCLFRVVQQGLANVVKHSGAASAAVDISAKSNDLVLHVTDAGRGFDTASAGEGLGLISMRERVHLIGGRLNISSKVGLGTELTAVVPVERAIDKEKEHMQSAGKEVQ